MLMPRRDGRELEELGFYRHWAIAAVARAPFYLHWAAEVRSSLPFVASMAPCYSCSPPYSSKPFPSDSSPPSSASIGTENEDSSARYYSGCSSSKFSLHGHGVFTKQSASQCEATKRKHASNIPASANLETSSNKLMFRKLTVSPLRRFKLIDSDSDDPSISEGGYIEANKVHSSLKRCRFWIFSG